MKVELIDLRDRFKEEEKTILKIVKKVLSKGNLILTKEVQNFEKSICKFKGAKF
jgi:dTDP-4-amino-4,6-dideoxygalactose transaminase